MMMYSAHFTVFIAFTLVWITSATNILFLAGLPSPSHHIWNREIINALATKGHNVTVLSIDVDSVEPENVHYIRLEGVYEKFHTDFVKAWFEEKKPNPFKELINLYDDCCMMCEFFYETNGSAQLLEYPDDFRFDLVVYDFTTFGCLLPFLHKFNYPPLIAVSAYNVPPFTSDMVGGHQYYAYVPHLTVSQINPEMNFLDRTMNTLIYAFDNMYRRHFALARLQQFFLAKFGTQIPSLSDLEQRAVLIFVNIHPAMCIAQPLPPNLIPVAGLHIKDANRLPSDIESFVNSARKGAVLISFGTNMRRDLMSIEKLNAIIQALRELPDYHFVWKFDLPATEVPPNVLIRPWLPQSDLLANPNVKAFFTHSGLLSTQEAVWWGVPLLCMPFGLDQFQNAFHAKRIGMAEIVDFNKFTTNEIKSKLSNILEDPKYATASKQLSQGFRDQKESPLERAVWWIEWVLRNPHPEYLKSPSLKLGHVAANNYDVVAFFTVCAMLTVFVLWKILKLCTSVSIKKPKNSNKIKNN